MPSEKGIIKEMMPFEKEITLSHDDRMISLSFAALSYCTPEKNNYAYKLDGFDKDWIDAHNYNKATYTNLPAGHYLFHVKASNNAYVWNENGAALKIVVKPPFYWSIPSKILYILLFALAIAFLVRVLLKNSERKHQKSIEDISVQKEKELYDSKIQFFTTVAHEIKTPVSLIIAPLEKIRNSNVHIPEEIGEDMNVIYRNSHRLLALVGELLDFRNMEAGTASLNMHFTQNSINDIVAAVAENFRFSLEQAGIDFMVNLPDKDIIADVDGEALTKVVSNLLSNARKYARGKIQVYCGYADDRNGLFEIRVTDDGPGISQENREKIFKPFFQIQGAKPGTGLGLSIVKGLVSAHGGSVDVQSELGKGSTFILTMPLRQSVGALNDIEEGSQTAEEQPSETNAEKPVMLIVEDNAEMLNFLANSFADDFITVKAQDGKEALEMLGKHNVSMIISDLMMPVMDGAELCKAVRSDQNYSHIPFIILTAKVDLDSKIKSMDIGADAYIEKPFSLQYLKSCIRNLLELRKMLRGKFSRMPLVPLDSIAANSADEKFLFKLNKLVEQNFSNPDLSVNFLAREMCISRSGLFAKIKTLADVTPNELIQIIRLKKGAELLLENKYMISEISYMVGFNNPSYFAKCFQKQFGVRPNEFSRLHDQKDETEEGTATEK